MTGTSFNGLIFEDLRLLDIGCINLDPDDGPIEWEDIDFNNTAITELAIDRFWKDDDPLDIAAITRNLRGLQSLIIKCKMTCDGTFLDIIRQHCDERMKLKLDSSLLVDVSTAADSRGLVFRNFPTRSY